MKFKSWRWLSVIVLLSSALFYLYLGSFQISFSDIIHLLTGQAVSEQAHLIFFSFRLPRLLLAMLVGGSLAVAGFILQSVTRNPIADIGLLGINSGAACGSVIYFWLVGNFFTEINHVQYANLLTFGLLGAFLAIALNFFLSFRQNHLNMALFILNGIGIQMGFAAVTTYFSLKINPNDYSQVNNWLEGSIGSASWETTQKIMPVVLISLLLIGAFQNKLLLLRYDDLHLKNIGFGLVPWRLFFLTLAALLVSATVFVAGSISFVSLLVPHFTLLYTKRSDKALLPLVILNGMSVMIIADLLAKNLFAPNEIPLNAVLGTIGIPYLIFLYLKTRRQKHAN